MWEGTNTSTCNNASSRGLGKLKGSDTKKKSESDPLYLVVVAVKENKKASLVYGKLRPNTMNITEH